MPDPRPADLAHALDSSASRLGPFARVEYFSDVESTNDLALAMAARGAPHGTVVLADAQRSGRGRQGRAWFSPAGAGIYLSAIIRPEAWGRALSLVTLAAGVATVRGLHAATGLSLELKWPNDVVIGRPWRKLAGILAESAATGPQIDAVVVGIGVNIRRSAFPPDIAHRATAIEMETDRAVDPAAAAVEILAGLAAVMPMLGDDRGGDVLDEWRRYARAGLGGAQVRWNDEQGAHRGLVRDVDASGALVVDEGGALQRLVAGEVWWEKLSRG